MDSTCFFNLAKHFLPDWIITTDSLDRKIVLSHLSYSIERSFDICDIFSMSKETLEQIFLALHEEALSKPIEFSGCPHLSVYCNYDIVNDVQQTLIFCKSCNELLFPKYIPGKIIPNLENSNKSKNLVIGSIFPDNSTSNLPKGKVTPPENLKDQIRYLVEDGQLKSFRFDGQEWVCLTGGSKTLKQVPKSDLKLGQRKVKFDLPEE